MSGAPEHGPPRARPRARPVADAPVQALCTRAGELAQGWAITLIEERSPERIGEVPTSEIARLGPGLIASLIASLASDAQLEGLASYKRDSPSGDIWNVLFTQDHATAVQAIEALRGVLWEAILQECCHARARGVAELSDRLACCCSILLASSGAEVTLEPDAISEPDTAGSPEAVGAEEAWQPAEQALVFVVDEQDEQWLQESRQSIEIRDVRREGPSRSWTRTIEHRLERFESDAVPFALLLGEVVPQGRPFASDPDTRRPSTLSDVKDALSRELGPLDRLCEEREGRYWLIVPEVDVALARKLAERLANSVNSALRATERHVEIAVGIALCPAHGRDTPTLCAHAEMDMYAAKAASKTLTADDPAAGL